MRSSLWRPVLQLHGAKDPAILPGTAAGSGRYVAGPYTWALLPRVGHFPHEEDPAGFDGALLDWLAVP
jgi:pimeloyl-ACP methyl ester carboxylesterase